MTVQFDRIKTADPVELTGGFANRSASRSAYAAGGKRAIDLLLILLFSPVFAGVMLIITLGLLVSRQNPFFFQLRIGKDGRVFRMYKFRTMVEDACQRLEEHLSKNPEARAEWDRDQKLKKDPRVTPFGRFLRKTSLDELPQVFNVILGDMSLVGPRPMMVEQKSLYPGDAYYDVRPGITGIWQISRRNDCGFRERADFDAHYAGSMSLRGDLSILVATVFVVLRGTGY